MFLTLLCQRALISLYTPEVYPTRVRAFFAWFSLCSGLPWTVFALSKCMEIILHELDCMPVAECDRCFETLYVMCIY